MIYKSSHLEEVTRPSPGHSGLFWLYQGLEASYDDSLFRFRISSKNGSGYKLNHPDRRKSPYPHPGTHHRFSHIGSYSGNFNFPSSDPDSPQKIGLDTSWTIPIDECDLTPSWYPNHYFGYCRCYKPDQRFPSSDSESPWKMGLGTSWTIQIGGGQIVHHQLFVGILCFPT